MITWRVPVTVVVLLGCAAAVAFLAFPPAHAARRSSGVTIRLPDKRPAADAAGAAGWVWPDGVPGWEPGFEIKGFNVSGVQPVEVQAAQLAAARHVLDADALRVLVSSRANTDGVLAIVAAPTLYQTPTRTCLAAVLQGDAPVEWECPGARPHDLAESHVLVAAAAFGAATPAKPGPANALYLVGVARGDVRRVVLVAGGLAPQEIYERGARWGQFETAVALHRPSSPPRLLVYGRHGVVQTLTLDLKPGRQRIFP